MQGIHYIWKFYFYRLKNLVTLHFKIFCNLNFYLKGDLIKAQILQKEIQIVIWVLALILLMTVLL